MRLSAPIKALLVLGLALRLHNHFHGPPLDYVTLAAAAFASWIGVPGPGEPLLIAAGVLAARHKLDLAEVLIVAWVGATVGGVGGWLIGLKAGRGLLLGRGPLRSLRQGTLTRGEELFHRFPRTAILLTPTWVAGIHNVRAAMYLPWNALGAAFWAFGIGVGAYFVGPPVIDAVDDVGLIGPIAIVALVLVGVGLELNRRRRRRGVGSGGG
ncbi:MAG: DedA family protein [Solirubrobacteraceae bacterium]